jgi:hypothetical protein
MKHQKAVTPDRREFMLRLGGAAMYGAPIVALLGAARPDSSPEQIAKHFHEAAVHLNEAYRLGREYRFSEEEMAQLRPAIEVLRGPIKGFPPKWCTIC